MIVTSVLSFTFPQNGQHYKNFLLENLQMNNKSKRVLSVKVNIRSSHGSSMMAKLGHGLRSPWNILKASFTENGNANPKIKQIVAQIAIRKSLSVSIFSLQIRAF